MSLALAFDTETSGFYRDNLPPDHPAQPNLVQLALLLYDEDLGRDVVSISLVVRPEGYEIPEQASKIHGITTAHALKWGIPLKTAMSVYTNLRAKSDRMVAHNLEFDWKVMESQLAKLKVTTAAPAPPPKMRICTKEASSIFVNLPPTEKMLRAGYNKPKPPTLTELVAFLFGETLEGAHDAMVDTVACRRCYVELRRRGVLDREPV